MNLIPCNSKFNAKIAVKILEAYSSGKNLDQIEKKKGFPSRRSILRWRSQFPEFGAAYSEALDAYTDSIIEECISIAETELDPKRAKVKIDIRTWIASRINRVRWGDRLEINQTVTLDITPALKAAVARMKAVAEPVKTLDVPAVEVL